MIPTVLRAKVTPVELRHRLHPGTRRPRFLGTAIAGRRHLQAADRPAGQGVGSMKTISSLIDLGGGPWPRLAACPGARPRTAEAILDRVDREHRPGNKIIVERDDHPRPPRTAARSSPSPGSRARTSPSPNISTRPARRAPKCSSSATSSGPIRPTTDRTISISGHMLRQSVMGSDLSYEDMMEDHAPARRSTTAKVAGEETVDGAACWVLELSSRGGTSRLLHAQDLGGQGAIRRPAEERFAKSGKLLKTPDVKSVDPRQDRWVPSASSSRTPSRRARGPNSRSTRSNSTSAIPAYLFDKAGLRR